MADKVFIEIFDQLSYKPYLFVNGSDRNKSCVSACMGLLVAMSVLGLTIYFLQETLARKTPVVFYNEREDFYPNFNLSSWPLYVGLSNGSNRVHNPQIFNIKIFFMKYGKTLTQNNTFVDDNVFTELPQEECDKNEFDKLNAPVIDNIHCLNPNKNNLTISGIYGDQTKGYTYLNIFLNRCVNGTGIICKPPEEIESYLKNVFFIFGTPMNYLNHNNVTDPFIIAMKTFNLPMSSTMFKRYYLKLRNVLYDTDIGFVFEEKDIKSSFTFSDQEVSIDIKVGAFLNPSALGQITFQSAPVSLYYNRSYSKLQGVVANAGGALNAIYTVGVVLMYFLTKKDYFLSLSNKCFSFEDDKDDEKVKAGLKDLKQNQKKIDEDRINHIKDYKTLKIEKDKINYFDLKLCEKLFPEQMCLCSENVKKYMVAEDLIMEKLSYEEILDNLTKFENLIEILFNEEQIASFNSIRKRKIGVKKDQSTHHIDSNVISMFRNDNNKDTLIIPLKKIPSVNENLNYDSHARINSEIEDSNISLNKMKQNKIKN